MRLRDIIKEDTDAQNTILLSILSFIKKRASESGIGGKIKTKALINMVKNAGDKSFNYDTLAKANENNPAVKNLIKSFNQEEVIIGQNDPQDVFNPDQAKNPVDTVAQMAKKALNKRM